MTVLETTVKLVASMPLNFTAEVPVPAKNPFPFMVTMVFCGPDVGEKDVIVGAAQLEVTLPFKVKSSKRNVPFPVAPLSEITTVTVPVSPEIVLATLVVPSVAPVVPIVPLPALIPLMVIDQFCGPKLLLTLQKSKEVISA
ncbi:hypothetical protein D3C86_1597170 [compost metagenome]